MRALRLGGPEAHETARRGCEAALKIDRTHLGGVARPRRHRVASDGEDDEAIDAFTQGARASTATTRRRCSRAPRRTAAPATRRTRARDYEAALKLMEEDDPNRRDAAARLASLLRDAGDYDDAVEVLRETVRVSGTNARIYTELGLIYIAQKRLELAQLVLAKALELDAKDPAVYNALALLAQRQGKAQEAFERFDQAASLDAELHRRAVQQGDRAARRRRLRASQDRARRRSSKRRPDDYAAQVVARRRASRPEGIARGEEGLRARDQRSAEAQHARAPTRCGTSRF